MQLGVFIPIGNNGWLISTTSPQYMPTFDLNRTIVEKYPASPEAEFAGWQVGSVYEDRKAWDRAASTYSDLATRFPQTRYDAWWRAGDIYDKRLKNETAARAAYSKVPSSSPKYKDAQKRLQSR